AGLGGDVLLPHWAFGLRAGVGHLRSESSDEGDREVIVGLITRVRWTAGRFDFEFGPTAGARVLRTQDHRGTVAPRLGTETSLGFSLTSHLSLFARFESGIEWNPSRLAHAEPQYSDFTRDHPELAHNLSDGLRDAPSAGL